VGPSSAPCACCAAAAGAVGAALSPVAGVNSICVVAKRGRWLAGWRSRPRRCGATAGVWRPWVPRKRAGGRAWACWRRAIQQRDTRDPRSGVQPHGCPCHRRRRSGRWLRLDQMVVEATRRHSGGVPAPAAMDLTRPRSPASRFGPALLNDAPCCDGISGRRRNLQPGESSSWKWGRPRPLTEQLLASPAALVAGGCELDATWCWAWPSACGV